MLTKKLAVAAAAAALCVLGTFPPAAIAQTPLEVPRVSPKATVSQVVGVAEVKITYSRPGVKGRVIWGGLVPYDKVWRTGANEATTILFGDNVMIEGQPLAAGTYSLATIPGPTEWTVIFNKKTDLWGAYEYKQEDDALRIKVKPETAPMTEWMIFSFPSLSTDSAEIALSWEKLKIAFRIKFDVVNKVLEGARKAVPEAKADDWRTPLRAAMFCVENKANLEEAARWVEKALTVNQNYYTLFGKARLLAETGKRAEAIATAKKAIEVGKAAQPPADTAPAELAIADWEKAK